MGEVKKESQSGAGRGVGGESSVPGAAVLADLQRRPRPRDAWYPEENGAEAGRGVLWRTAAAGDAKRGPASPPRQLGQLGWRRPRGWPMCSLNIAFNVLYLRKRVTSSAGWQNAVNINCGTACDKVCQQASRARCN